MDVSSSIPPDTNHAPNYLTICGLLLALAVGLCVARILSRIRPSPHLSLDDYFIATAAILSVASYITAIINTAHGWGHISHYVSPANRIVAFECLFAQQIFWCFSTALVRISVACSLLRLSTSRAWKWSLYAMITIQIMTYIGFLIFLFGHVSPIRANWEPVPNAKWWDRKYEVTYGWVANPIMMCSDFALALMPIQLIRTLHRTLREKILICSLMAMGLLAAGIAGYKMTLSRKVFKGDILSTTVELSLWNRLEELVGITAACMPCLKSPAERFLHRIGVLSTNFGLSKPSCVITLEEQRVRAAEPSCPETCLLGSLRRYEENGSVMEMATPGSKGSISTSRADNPVH